MPAEQSGWLYSWIFDHISKQGCHKEKYQSNLRDVEWGLIQPYLYYALCQLVSIYMCPVSRSMKTKRERVKQNECITCLAFWDLVHWEISEFLLFCVECSQGLQQKTCIAFHLVGPSRKNCSTSNLSFSVPCICQLLLFNPFLNIYYIIVSSCLQFFLKAGRDFLP